jgi:hypothetical protein
MEEIRPAVQLGVGKANQAAQTLDTISRQTQSALESLHAVVSAMTEQSQAANIAVSVEQGRGGGRNPVLRTTGSSGHAQYHNHARQNAVHSASVSDTVSKHTGPASARGRCI